MSHRPPIPNRRPPVKPSARKNSEEIAKLLKEGLALHNAGKINDARLIYEQILTKQSNHLDALQLLATTHTQQKNSELALQYFNKALLINSTNAVVLNNKGVTLQELKRFDEALQSCDQALHIKPDYAEAYYNKGKALIELKRFDEALQSCNQALHIKPDYAEAFNNKGITLKNSNDSMRHCKVMIRHCTLSRTMQRHLTTKALH